MSKDWHNEDLDEHPNPFHPESFYLRIIGWTSALVIGPCAACGGETGLSIGVDGEAGVGVIGHDSAIALATFILEQHEQMVAFQKEIADDEDQMETKPFERNP